LPNTKKFSKYITYPQVASKRYLIDVDGNIFDEKLNKNPNIRSDKDGYNIVSLSTLKKRSQNFKVHRLVAYEFIKNDDKESKTQVNHKDENKQNNNVTNLEWCSPAYNINYGMRTKRSVDHRAKRIALKNVNTGEVVTFDSISSACRLMQLDMRHLGETLNGKRKTINGYKAWYLESPAYNVITVPIEKIQANTYNPNHVAPPEMKLLYESIKDDNYTMPIVCYYLKDTDKYEIVDGYHRYTVMLNHKDIYDREHGCLPVSVIDKPIEDRIASTIRHNRARGTHDVDLMKNIVKELTESGMSDNWIMKNIGMDADELLRLKQINGLASLFKDKNFGNSWE